MPPSMYRPPQTSKEMAATTLYSLKDLWKSDCPGAVERLSSRVRTAPKSWKKPLQSQLSSILKLERKYSHSVSETQQSCLQCCSIIT